MKKIIFLLLSIFFVITCCNDEKDILPTSQEKGTRSPSTEVSPTFNWEDVGYISLFNIPGTITLPWYSGATSNIPDCILQDYKAEDGWKMVYNTCSPSDITQDDKYYLIFYNIFSGRLRGYVYNKNDVTSNNHTFWQLTFNNATTLLNDMEEYTLAGDVLTSNRKMMVSSLANTPTKSLTRGWNVFETDFLMYDPNVASKSIAMSLSAYDINTTQITLTGDANFNSEGTMVTVTKIPTSSGNNILNGAISLLGKPAGKLFSKFFNNNILDEHKTDTLSEDDATDIIKKGGNWLVNKFFGKQTTQTITSNSDIKISTDGTIQTNGTIISQQQSNISPISHLMLPGSNPTPEDILLPSYNEPLGVWNLKYPPIIVSESFDWFHSFEEISDRGPKVIGAYFVRTHHTLADITSNININPSILPYIEKYEVEAKIMIINKKATKTHSTMAVIKIPSIFVKGSNNGTLYYPQLDIQNYYFSSKDSLLILANKNTSETIIGEKLTSLEDVITADEYIKLTTYKSPINGCYSITTEKEQEEIVKVTVKIYPKAPYNTAPIVTTRTFKPQLMSTR